jgi:hypothetical protein
LGTLKQSLSKEVYSDSAREEFRFYWTTENGCGMEFFFTGSITGSCEYGYEPSTSIKFIYLVQLMDS